MNSERTYVYRMVTTSSALEFKIDNATSPNHHIVITSMVPLNHTLTEPIKIVFTPLQSVPDYLTNFTKLNFCNSRTTWYINPNINITNQIEYISLYGLEKGKFEFFDILNQPLNISIILTTNIPLNFS